MSAMSMMKQAPKSQTPSYPHLKLRGAFFYPSEKLCDFTLPSGFAVALSCP